MWKISNKCLFALLITIALSIGSAIQVYAKKLGNMPEVSNMSIFYVYKNRAFAVDAKVHVDVYSLKPFRFIKQASNYGGGPGENFIPPSIMVYPDSLYMYRLGKCMFFSHDGDYIKEYRIPKPNLYNFAPLGDNFLTHNITNDKTVSNHELSICTYSEKEGIKHKKIVYMYVINFPKKKGIKNSFSPYGRFIRYSIVDDKIFIPDSTRGMFAEIYDFNGNRLSQINLDYEKIKVSEENKKNIKEILESIPLYNQTEDMYYLDIPEYYPPYQYATQDNGKVYFLTYYKKGQMREIIIADWKGKFIKQSYVPCLIKMEIVSCAISDNKFYYIYENEETEEWELHAEDIK